MPRTHAITARPAPAPTPRRASSALLLLVALTRRAATPSSTALVGRTDTPFVEFVRRE